MTGVFLDTSGLIALVHTHDQWHVEAESVWQGLLAEKPPLVTSELVLIELGDGLSRIAKRPMALELRDRLTSSARVEVVRPDSEVLDAAWELYRDRSDKEWGMTDCVSMTIMQSRNITRVFTNDRHFEQAGFERLIR